MLKNSKVVSHTKGFLNKELFIIIVTISDFYQRTADGIIHISVNDHLAC